MNIVLIKDWVKNLKSKPTYFYSMPSLFKGIQFRLLASLGWDLIQYRLPWGNKINISLKKAIGRAVAFCGVYELGMMEIIERLLKPGDCVVDVGANIGYVTSLMARKVGPKGKVLAFEPEPTLAEKLKNNVALWDRSTNAEVTIIIGALSKCSGTQEFFSRGLMVDRNGNTNSGLGTLEKLGNPYNENSISVDVHTLDTFFSEASSQIDLMKLDVEGHELSVFEGSEKLFSEHRIRYVVFEEHGGNKAPTIRWLQKHRYFVWAIQKNFNCVELIPVEKTSRVINWEPTNYFASIEANVGEQFSSGSWRVLRFFRS